MRKHLTLLMVSGIVAIPVFTILSIFVSTRRGMEEFRTRIVPGITVAELHRFAGKPAQILHRGGQLQRGQRSYVIPELDEHTAIHFYPKGGMPYFNVYVLIDERRSEVIRSDVENLWW